LTPDKSQGLEGAPDTFVFAPNLGEQTNTQLNVHNDVIDSPQPQFTQLALAGDTFVFAPNLGEQTSTQFNVHNDTIDPRLSYFTQLAELLAQPHQDAATLAHDAIDPMDNAATLAAQHAHHFLV
jgi:hypothetical protein